jgi:transcription elongation factor Elf1
MGNDIEKIRGKPFPCPVCERKCLIRISKSGKPYMVCDSCGVQLFVRYQEGLERLIEKITTFRIF